MSTIFTESNTFTKKKNSVQNYIYFKYCIKLKNIIIYKYKSINLNINYSVNIYLSIDFITVYNYVILEINYLLTYLLTYDGRFTQCERTVWDKFRWSLVVLGR